MHMIYFAAVKPPDTASTQDTPEEMELDEIPDQEDDDDDDDERDELASDAEGGASVSVTLLLRLTGTRCGASRHEEAADGMSAGLAGWPKSRTMETKTSRKQSQEHGEEAKKV